ncbi:hypothetical protein SNEBB_001753 [Seison nebaliae]|nr:hypothetical protein SNEBB_001753 [Seison nebaliae]
MDDTWRHSSIINLPLSKLKEDVRQFDICVFNRKERMPITTKCRKFESLHSMSTLYSYANKGYGKKEGNRNKFNVALLRGIFSDEVLTKMKEERLAELKEEHERIRLAEEGERDENENAHLPFTCPANRTGICANDIIEKNEERKLKMILDGLFHRSIDPSIPEPDKLFIDSNLSAFECNLSESEYQLMGKQLLLFVYRYQSILLDIEINTVKLLDQIRKDAYQSDTVRSQLQQFIKKMDFMPSSQYKQHLRRLKRITIVSDWRPIGELCESQESIGRYGRRKDRMTNKNTSKCQCKYIYRPHEFSMDELLETTIRTDDRCPYFALPDFDTCFAHLFRSVRQSNRIYSLQRCSSPSHINEREFCQYPVLPPNFLCPFHSIS